MIYLTYAPIQRNKRWTVKSGNKTIAEVRIHPDGRCTVKAPDELCIDTLDAITAFMRGIKPQS